MDRNQMPVSCNIGLKITTWKK